MRVSNNAAALTAVLTLASSSRSTAAGEVSANPAATYLPTSAGYSAGSCLGDRYRASNPPESTSTPTCAGSSEDKFWKSISLNVPSTCIAGRRLAVEGLSFESSFDADAYDFAVSWSSQVGPGVRSGPAEFLCCSTDRGGCGCVDWDG